MGLSRGEFLHEECGSVRFQGQRGEQMEAPDPPPPVDRSRAPCTAGHSGHLRSSRPFPLWLFLLKIQSWLTTISSFIAKVSTLTSDPFRLLEMCLETEGRAGLSCSFYVAQVYLCQTQAESHVPLKMTYVHICGFGAHIFKC